ncbi:MAG TPA: hypothetical protein VGV18_09735, partial [Verrucomicrobiae bacterium]|nr:hypothetical protein [Verrucomicrobiae bacterium]
MSVPAKQIVASGAFDDVRSRDLRFLQEAARLGPLTVLLWTDDAIRQVAGTPPKFPFAERHYLLNAVRYVEAVIPAGIAALDSIPEIPGLRPQIWVDTQTRASINREKFCRRKDMLYRVFKEEELAGFPESAPSPAVADRKKVVATGCYDWLHSGHVRFCEEVSAYGEL